MPTTVTATSVGTWATSPQIQMPGTTPTEFAANTTLRQIVHTSIGGSTVRVRLSNEIGIVVLSDGGECRRFSTRGCDCHTRGFRQAVNEWIRSSGDFDAVIDFDLVTRDPSQPTRLLPQYDSGDHLHPNDAGYLAMGQTVPLRLSRENIDSGDR